MILRLHSTSLQPVLDVVELLGDVQVVPKKRGIKNFNFLTQYLGLQTALRKVFVLKIKLCAFTFGISSFAIPKPHLKLNLGGFIITLIPPPPLVQQN